MTDPEVLEMRFPVRLDEFSIRRGSGGAGRCKGGDGIVRRLCFLEPMTVTVLSSHRKTRAFGVHGGEPGLPGENSVLCVGGGEEMLGGNATSEVQPGDIFILKTPGGGGYGKP
jgi:5-oxoprolinase (ATP-hydrolysing)